MKASNSSWFAFVIRGKSAFLLSVPDSMKFLAARYLKILQFPGQDFKKGFEPIVDCVDSMTSFIITCILGMTPDTSDTHHSEKCKCQQLDYVHPPTNSHQKNKEGSRREEKFSYATSPHAAVAAAAHHVALLH